MLIYLASPYSHSNPEIVEDRYHRVLRVTTSLIENGNIVFSPVVHTHFITKLLNEKRKECHLEFTFWSRYDLKILSRCDSIWILTLVGWRESKGIKEELEFAKSLAMPIHYIQESDRIGGRAYEISHHEDL